MFSVSHPKLGMLSGMRMKVIPVCWHCKWSSNKEHLWKSVRTQTTWNQETLLQKTILVLPDQIDRNENGNFLWDVKIPKNKSNSYPRYKIETWNNQYECKSMETFSVKNLSWYRNIVTYISIYSVKDFRMKNSSHKRCQNEKPLKYKHKELFQTSGPYFLYILWRGLRCLVNFNKVN